MPIRFGLNEIMSGCGSATVAPDLRAFRGHAPERARREGEPIEDYHDRLIIADAIDFAVFIARDSDRLGSPGRRGWLTRRTRAAGARRKAA